MHTFGAEDGRRQRAHAITGRSDEADLREVEVEAHADAVRADLPRVGLANAPSSASAAADCSSGTG